MQATLLSWVFWLLSKNPKVWEKLRQEVLYEVGKELPNYQQLKDCRYLKWVINEGNSSPEFTHSVKC
jgi:cytochrome P450